MGIEVRPATGRWDDFASFMVPRKPGGRGCVCMAYRNSSLDMPGRIAHMRALCDSVMETNMLTEEDALSMMVNDFQPMIVNTYAYGDHKTTSPESVRAYGAIAGRYILGDGKGKDPYSGMLFLSRQKMKDWCVEHRIELQKVLDHAAGKGYYLADQPRFNLTRGTTLATVTTRCIQFDTNKMDKPVSDGLKIVATIPHAVAASGPPVKQANIRGTPPA